MHIYICKKKKIIIKSLEIKFGNNIRIYTSKMILILKNV